MVFRAFRVERTEERQFVRSIVERKVDDLPAGELLIDVAWSSLNYKDALSAIGNPGVTRNYPHTPGIDAAGTVVESASPDFSPGDEVIVCGFDLGMNTPGGFGQRIRVPADWAIAMPNGLDARISMILGTAGFTAALSVDKLEAVGMTTGGGPVLVTGATGGVGSVAVMLLARLGYEVHAVTGKASRHDFLRSLGASAVLTREAALEGANKALLRPTWGGAVDTVGGPNPLQRDQGSPLQRERRGVRSGGVAGDPRHGLPVHPAGCQPARRRLRRSADNAQAGDLEPAGGRVEARSRTACRAADARYAVGGH